MFGRFLELSLASPDITASAAFYEALGLTQLHTGDAWPYRYGVFSDGRFCIGVHEQPIDAPALSFVRPGLTAAHAQLEALGTTVETAHLSEDSLHFLQLRDPDGQAVRLLEARTFSPTPLGGSMNPDKAPSVDVVLLSLPARDRDISREFWERAGLVALGEEEWPLPHRALTGDGLNLGLHEPRRCASPLIAVESAAPEAVRYRLEPAPPGRLLQRPLGSVSVLSPEGLEVLVLSPP